MTKGVSNKSSGRLRGIRILHEDPDVIVVSKAAGVLTCETRRGGEYTVESALTDYVRKGQSRSSKRVYLVHRLDRETSGVMMVAKTEAVQDYFRSNWNGLTDKTYLALIEGDMAEDAGAWESYLAENDDLYVHSVSDPKAGKKARTEWKVLERRKDFRGRASTLLEVHLKSGRKNQIRVHAKESGHPIVGDAKYNANFSSGRVPLHLHSLTLKFIHPHTGEEMSFTDYASRQWK